MIQRQGLGQRRLNKKDSYSDDSGIVIREAGLAAYFLLNYYVT